MSDGAVVAALAGALVVAGVLLVVAAMTGTELLPRIHAGPRWRRRQLKSRRTVAETCAAAGLGLGAWVATSWPVAGLATAIAVVVLPRMLGGRAAQHRIARLDAMEAWSRQLADVLTAGTGIEDALLTTAGDPPPAIAAEVTALGRRLEFRTPTEDALRAFADELAHPLGDTITAALILASGVRGRGLHDVLTALADTVAKDVAMQRETDAERATHRTTAIWVVVALGAYTVFAVANRAYVAPFATMLGQMMLALVAALYAGTLGWLHRLASPAPAHRFLPASARSRS